MSRIHIDIRNKSYGTQLANSSTPGTIQAFSLSVAPGEFVCLVGPSGCGKTTLLNIIAGLDRDFDGAIQTEPERRQDLRMAYVFQEPRLLPWRTIMENILLALPEPDKDELVRHLFEVMDLSAVRDYYPERVSLGMSRRVALVRAFAVEPDLLLMDEPFVSLDAPTARRIRELLVRVWQERPHTVLFVTHDLDEAISLGNRIIFLSPDPMKIAAEVQVDIPAFRRTDDTAIRDFRKGLVANYPQIANLI